MQAGRYHHIFDFRNCQNINDPKVILKFIKELAKAINMKIIGGPIIAEGVPNNPGWSAVAIVDFSHISVHTFTHSNEALIDVFSCREYNKDKALEVCQKFFATQKTEIRHKEVWWG